MGKIILALSLVSSFACTRIQRESPSKLNTETQNDQVEQLSESPVLQSEPNCADLAKADQGHSPIRSMNHCPPSPETKEAARAQNQLGGR